MITREDDAPPIVCVIHASLRRAASRPEVAERMNRLQGRAVLRSTVGPQAATIDFARGSVHVTHGVAADADLVISGDLDTMGRPAIAQAEGEPASPAIRGSPSVSPRCWRRHRPETWPEAVDELWSWAEGQDGRPDLLRVVCTDDGVEHVVGEPGGSRVEVHGPAWALLGVFTGADHVGAAALEGRVRVVAELAVLSTFVGVLARFMLGDEGGRR